MTTISAYITSIVTTLTVSGVTRKYTEPPTSLSTADLPASFPYGFRREQSGLTFRANGGWPTNEADFVIALEPVGQNTQPANYALVQTIANNLDAAIAGAAPNAIGKSPVTWVIQGGNQQMTIAGTMYWIVMATITARG